MKSITKLSVFVLLACGISSGIQAQISFGLKGGMNACSIINYDDVKLPKITAADFTADGNNSYRIGFNAGLFFSYAVANNRVVFQPELLYSQQGMKNTGELLGFANESSVEITMRMDYINIPLMVQFYFIKHVLYFEAGPQLGFLVNSVADFKLNANLNGFSEVYENSWDIGEHLNTFDFGFAVGLGFQIPKFPLGINARYSIGITNVSKDDAYNEGTYNSVFQIGAFFKFGNQG